MKKVLFRELQTCLGGYTHYFINALGDRGISLGMVGDAGGFIDEIHAIGKNTNKRVRTDLMCDDIHAIFIDITVFFALELGVLQDAEPEILNRFVVLAGAILVDISKNTFVVSHP